MAKPMRVAEIKFCYSSDKRTTCGLCERSSRAIYEVCWVDPKEVTMDVKIANLCPACGKQCIKWGRGEGAFLMVHTRAVPATVKEAIRFVDSMVANGEAQRTKTQANEETLNNWCVVITDKESGERTKAIDCLSYSLAADHARRLQSIYPAREDDPRQGFSIVVERMPLASKAVQNALNEAADIFNAAFADEGSSDE